MASIRNGRFLGMSRAPSRKISQLLKPDAIALIYLFWADLEASSSKIPEAASQSRRNLRVRSKFHPPERLSRGLDFGSKSPRVVQPSSHFLGGLSPLMEISHQLDIW